MDLHTPYSTVLFRMILNDFEKFSDKAWRGISATAEVFVTTEFHMSVICQWSVQSRPVNDSAVAWLPSTDDAERDVLLTHSLLRLTSWGS